MLDTLPSLIIEQITDKLENGDDVIALQQTCKKLQQEVTRVQQWFEKKIRKNHEKGLVYSGTLVKLAVAGHINLHKAISKFQTKMIIVPYNIHSTIPPHDEEKGCCIVSDYKHLLNELTRANKSIAKQRYDFSSGMITLSLKEKDEDCIEELHQIKQNRRCCANSKTRVFNMLHCLTNQYDNLSNYILWFDKTPKLNWEEHST